MPSADFCLITPDVTAKCAAWGALGFGGDSSTFALALSPTPLASVVRDSLNFNPASVEDRDLKEILSSLAGVVGGVGALRTHASSAHGAGKKVYRVAPRHARLAVHSAHTIALFVLESWEVPNGT